MEVNWVERKFEDGTEQVMMERQPGQGWPPLIYIERVVRKNSRRKKWCIVSRRKTNANLYPPKLGGPYPTLDVAKVMMIVMLASGDLDT